MALPKPAECDVLCAYRPCYQWGEDKGHYTAGIGYTGYYKKPIPACLTRLLRGCPVGAREGVSASMAVDIAADILERTKAIKGAKNLRELNILRRELLYTVLSIIAQKGDI